VVAPPVVVPLLDVPVDDSELLPELVVLLLTLPPPVLPEVDEVVPVTAAVVELPIAALLVVDPLVPLHAAMPSNPTRLTLKKPIARVKCPPICVCDLVCSDGV
jgi:hypothetical protein